MAKLSKDLSVGQLAARSGVAVSTIHFYEAEGLIFGWRTAANHRRYDRAMLRRVSVIRVAQSLGLTLASIKSALDRLPAGKTPSTEDWARMSQVWQGDLDARIEMLTKLRNQLDFCIGCGCLSLKKCPLHNADDQLGAEGPGPRRLMEG